MADVRPRSSSASYSLSPFPPQPSSLRYDSNIDASRGSVPAVPSLPPSAKLSPKLSGPGKPMIQTSKAPRAPPRRLPLGPSPLSPLATSQPPTPSTPRFSLNGEAFTPITPSTGRPKSLVEIQSEQSIERRIKACRYLYQRLFGRGWLQLDPERPQYLPGIVLLATANNRREPVHEPSTVYPYLVEACQSLRLHVAFTMSSDLTRTIFMQMEPHETSIPIPGFEFRVPIVESLEALAKGDPRVRRRHHLCLVRKENVVLVWSRHPKMVISQATEIERALMKMAFGIDNIDGSAGYDLDTDIRFPDSGYNSGIESGASTPRQQGFTSKNATSKLISGSTNRLSRWVRESGKGDDYGDKRSSDERDILPPPSYNIYMSGAMAPPSTPRRTTMESNRPRKLSKPMAPMAPQSVRHKKSRGCLDLFGMFSRKSEDKGQDFGAESPPQMREYRVTSVRAKRRSTIFFDKKKEY